MHYLQTIWDTHREDIRNLLGSNFNIMIGINPKLSLMTTEEAAAIETIIYNYCDTLRQQYSKFENEDITLHELQNIIIQNIVPLTLELRTMVEVLNYKEVGKSHNKQAVRPYDNDNQEEADNIIGDNINYTNLTSLITATSFLKENNTYLNKIYQELRQIVLLLKEGY